jgi:hypothetical protein
MSAKLRRFGRSRWRDGRYRVLEMGFFICCEIPGLSDNRLRYASTAPATIRLLELPRRSNGETGIENP